MCSNPLHGDPCEWHDELPELNIKAWLALRYEQYKRLAPAMNGAVAISTLTLVVMPWLYDFAWSGPYLFPVVFLGIAAALVVLPWIYYDGLGMRTHERAALLDLDPMQQDKLTPKEQALVALFVQTIRGDEAAAKTLEEAAETGSL